MPKQYLVASLFSGAGGIDLGLTYSNRFQVVFANEILEAPARTYSQNTRAKLISPEPLKHQRIEVPPSDLPCIVQSGVELVDFASLRDAGIDVVVGGPPCQDFSIVRATSAERRGTRVKRGRLYAYFVRALKTIQPKAFIFENVPGLISTDGGGAYETILEDFRHLNLRWKEISADLGVGGGLGSGAEGYHLIFADVVHMARLGVPQCRKRLIVMGIRDDIAKHSPEETEVASATVKQRLEGAGTLTSVYPLTALEVYEGRPLTELQAKYTDIMKEYEGAWTRVRNSRAQEWKSEVWDKMTRNVLQDYLLVNGIRRSKEEGGVLNLDLALEEHADLLRELGYAGRPVYLLKDDNNGIPRESHAVMSRMRQIPPDENHEFVRETDWEVEGRGMSLIYRRLHPLKPSNTVVAYGGGGTWGYHYEQARSMLTNRERARLQTFPDSFAFEGTFSEVRAMIGEAVPPLAAKRIGSALAEVLDALSIGAEEPIFPNMIKSS